MISACCIINALRRRARTFGCGLRRELSQTLPPRCVTPRPLREDHSSSANKSLRRRAPTFGCALRRELSQTLPPAALLRVLCVRIIPPARTKLRLEPHDFSCYSGPCDRWSLVQFCVAPEESPNTKRQHASRKRGNLGRKPQMTDSITENIPPRTIFERSETRN